MIQRMTAYKFTRKFRLRSGRDFERVYNRRCSDSNARLLVFACENELDFARVGLSVSRKVGSAVVRNRWKRLLRESFRLSRAQLPAGIDLVLIPRGDTEPRLDDLCLSLVDLTRRACRKLTRS